MLTLAMAASVLSAAAEGYQVNTFSTKQEGMGHAGVAMKLGAESQIFNPGALAFSDKTFEISGAVSAIKATATCTHDGADYKTVSKIATPMNFSAAFRIYDNFYGGVAFYTPYGSSIDWGQSWPGAVLNQSVSLQVMTVQPTLSWRPIPRLSVGAGLMISWGSVDLNKGLVSASSLNKLIGLMNMTGQFGQLAEYQGVTPASVNLNGKSELALGFNVGALYEINDKVNVGASFRSKQTMHVKAGDATVSYADEQARVILGQTLDNLNATNFDASMPAPYVFTFGAAYKPIPRLTLAFDAQLNGWGTYRQLDITFANQQQFDQHLTKDYHNAWTFHLGGQFATTDRLDLRAGLMVDLSPVNDNYYNPETPGMTKYEPAVGLSFRPVKGLSIDLAFMYVFSTGKKGVTGEYDDFLAPIYNGMLDQAQIPAALMPRLPETGTFKADYKTRALIPSLGVSYSF